MSIIDAINFFSDKGSSGIFGLSGIYLIFVSIMGRIIPIWGIISTEIPIKAIYKRVLLGVFGIILAFTPIYRLYTGEQLFPPLIQEGPNQENNKNGGGSNLLEDSGRFVDYQTDILPDFEAHQRFSLATLLISVGYTPTSSNSRIAKFQEDVLVEYFGLKERNIRRLRHSRFQNEVYVYVKDIQNPNKEPFNVYVIVSDMDSWPSSERVTESRFRELISDISEEDMHILTVRERGESIEFSHSERTYRITVTRIYEVLFGSDRIAIEIYEIR